VLNAALYRYRTGVPWCGLEVLIGNKAYDAEPFVEILTRRGITPVIQSEANRKTKRACDFALYANATSSNVSSFFGMVRLSDFFMAVQRFSKHCPRNN
jgi:hypothetical protein